MKEIREQDGEGARRPIRVLHVTNIETGNYYLNNLADYTDRRIVTYFALTFGSRGGFVEQLEQRGVKSCALDCLNRFRYAHAAGRLREIIKRERIDIVHGHLFEPALVSLAVGKALGRRVIVTRHHSDAIYRIPQRMKRAGYLQLERIINAGADHLIAPSQMVRDILLHRENVPAGKVSLIPYGQTTERFDAITPETIARVRGELGMESRFSIVCVSRLHPEKGHRYLFDAFAWLSSQGVDANLYLVGQGGIREELETAAKASGIAGRVHFLGWRDDALAIMAAADLIVHPSLQEALPSAVIETLMLRRPLVVTDVSGVRDVVGDNAHGVVVPPADAGALAAAILETMRTTETAIARAAKGRDFVLNYMDAGRVASEYMGRYRLVMAL